MGHARSQTGDWEPVKNGGRNQDRRGRFALKYFRRGTLPRALAWTGMDTNEGTEHRVPFVFDFHYEGTGSVPPTAYMMICVIV